MNRTEIADVLNCVLRLLSRSLPMYLHEAPAWTCRDDQRTSDALENLVADQQDYSHELVDRLRELDTQPAPGPARIEFTCVNDLSLDYLLDRLIELQQEDVAALERCVKALGANPPQRMLVEEIVGNAKGHLDILETLRSN